MKKITSMFYSSYLELKNLRSVTLAAFLVGIYAVSYSPFAGNFIIIPGMLEIRFGFLAIAVAAMLFGPVVAPIVAVTGDILGTILFYGGSFFWGYTLSWLIQGIVFALFFYKLKITIPRTALCMLFNTCVINLLLTTKWQEMMGFGTFEALFVKRLLQNIIMFPVNSVILFIVLNAVKSIHAKSGYALASNKQR